MTTQFDSIYHGLSPEVGKLRIAASGMAWMGNETKRVVTLAAADLKWAMWMRVARNYQLRVGMKGDRQRETFDGFTRDDHEKVVALLKQHFGVILEDKEISLKGWNWGTTDFRGQDLAFLVSNRTAFELPLQKVANSNIAGRTEVSLEFAPSATKPQKGAGDEMVEIRFYIPGTRAKEAASDAGSQAGDEEKEEAVPEDETSAAQAFHDAIKEKAELGEVPGDMIINFEEVLVLTPRGRYDVDMFPDFLRLRGKTYDYKINYDGIQRLFLLPKDDQHVLFILSLLTPIRQGQTRYQFLVMQFDREEEITAELNMEEEEIEKYDKLQRRYESMTFEVVSSVFRALSRNKIIGAGSFQSRNGQPGVKAHLKAIQGDLFILEKYIFFVAKAPLLIEIADIHQVMFSRVGGGAMTNVRTFDINVVTKSGPEHTFTSINKEEHEAVEAYLKSKKVRVKNQIAEDMAAAALDDDDDDEEMQSVASSGEEAPKPRRGGDDDDDSEEDEDFHASSSDAGSPSSESESDDEGAASASDASGDREIASKATKKKKVAKKDGTGAGKKKAKKNEDEAMDVDEDKPKPKPKPKAKKGSDDDEQPAKKRQKKDED